MSRKVCLRRNWWKLIGAYVNKDLEKNEKIKRLDEG